MSKRKKRRDNNSAPQVKTPVANEETQMQLVNGVQTNNSEKENEKMNEKKGLSKGAKIGLGIGGGLGILGLIALFLFKIFGGKKDDKYIDAGYYDDDVDDFDDDFNEVPTDDTDDESEDVEETPAE